MVVVKLKSIPCWKRNKQGGYEQTDGFYMDGILKSNLDSEIYNLPYDWDFVNQISGNNMVRVGKSVLAQQEGAYCADRLGTPWGIDNITMTAKEMIDFAYNAPKHSVIVYDEAAEGLRAAKNTKEVTEALVEFFDECGQLNHMFFIVAPNFFRLKQDVAVERSELLLNVYRLGQETKNELGDTVIKLQRGFFQFFDRQQKQKLYERYITKKTQSYSYITDLVGHFPDVYTVEPEAYKQKKRLSLKRIKAVPNAQNKYKEQRDELIRLAKELGASTELISSRLDLGLRAIQHLTQDRSVLRTAGAKKATYISKNPDLAQAQELEEPEVF